MVVCSMFLPVFSASILTFVGIHEVLLDMTACGSTPFLSWEKMSTCLKAAKKHGTNQVSSGGIDNKCQKFDNKSSPSAGSIINQ